MAEDQRVWLTTVDQGHCDAGIADVIKAALPFDDIPVVVVVVRGQILDRTSHEIGNDRVQRDTVTRDQDARLTRGAERRFQTLFLHRAIEGETGVHLAHAAIGTNGQDALARPFFAVGDWIVHFGHSNVVQGPAIRLGHRNKIGLVPQQIVQTAGEVVSPLQRVDQDGLPSLADHAAPIGNANDQCLGAGLKARLEVRILEAHIGPATRQAKLPDGMIRSPVTNALRHLRRQLVRRITEEQKVWCPDHWIPLIFCGQFGGQ